MDFDARRRAYVNRTAIGNGQPCGYTWQATTCTVVGAHVCEQRDARVAWFLAELIPLQQDAYIERLFDDESVTAAPLIGEADMVALLEATRRPSTTLSTPQTNPTCSRRQWASWSRRSVRSRSPLC